MNSRISITARSFAIGDDKWHVKGLVYGPFAPDSDGQFLPERPRLIKDLAHIRDIGANCIRLYTAPPPSLLDDALAQNLRIMIDVPWQKHRCFFEDQSAQRDALATVQKVARECGRHPVVFAVSVGNEIPHDIVRFYGRRRIERFIDRLLDCARQEAPDCLFTYTNYPSTEFLSPSSLDFYCANIYLHDRTALGNYLDRLQHLAGDKPLLIGEHGIDSIRHGTASQAIMLREQIECLFARGAAGSFVFSYTDDWFAGGEQIRDWAFGITTADRAEKPAAAALRDAWAAAPKLLPAAAPKVSVVVCCYNGAATLGECLHSLGKLDYPDYEVIVVDDGSVDQTPQVAAKFPQFKYIRQENRGLSSARNAGAQAASGQVIAYTDADCAVDRDWLKYLVAGMIAHDADAIGGPNLTPPSDNSIARCVAACPGNPCHVMLDDQHAEHIPGCNMAFRRESLMKVGGFDPRFKVAGDDVDVCWRLLDSGMKIAFAPAAVVWHHRRNSVRGYLKQQLGYGRSESLLQLKHPHRFNALGCLRWNGIIYGNGRPARGRTFHGQFGAACFQSIYRQGNLDAWSCFTMMEWHLLALFIASLSALYLPLLAVSGVMWCATLASAGRSALSASFKQSQPLWSRPLIFLLHLFQPIARRWHCLSAVKLPKVTTPAKLSNFKRISWNSFDLYWQSRHGIGREDLLKSLVQKAIDEGWAGDFCCEWEPHDIELFAGRWHRLRICTASEELGGLHRFTRARCTLHATWGAYIAIAASLIWLLSAFAAWIPWLMVFAGGLLAGISGDIALSRGRVIRGVASLLARPASACGLDAYALSESHASSQTVDEGQLKVPLYLLDPRRP